MGHRTRGLWQDSADCRGAEPEAFCSDTSDKAALNRLRDTAERYCGGCPALLECAVYADDSRAEGVWGGSFRVGPKYRRRPLIDHAPLLLLSDRRSGVRYGWKTA